SPATRPASRSCEARTARTQEVASVTLATPHDPRGRRPPRRGGPRTRARCPELGQGTYTVRRVLSARVHVRSTADNGSAWAARAGGWSKPSTRAGAGFLTRCSPAGASRTRRRRTKPSAPKVLDGAGDGAPRGPAGEQAPAQERALKRAVPVHAAAA